MMEEERNALISQFYRLPPPLASGFGTQPGKAHVATGFIPVILWILHYILAAAARSQTSSIAES